MIARLRRYRQDLHHLAEVSGREQKTQAYIIRELKRLGYQPRVIARTGVLAVLDRGAEFSLGWRAEMDGLKIKEDTRFSKTRPVMHACGHDGHMAILLTLAGLVKETEVNKNYNFVFLFQPAEEEGAGAQRVLKDPDFNKIKFKALFALHGLSALAAGKIQIKAGPIMACSNEFKYEIKAPASHITSSNPSALDIALETLNGWKQLAAEETGVRILQARFRAGMVSNVQAAKACGRGSLRSHDEVVAARVMLKMAALLPETGRIRFYYRYPAVVNDAAVTAQVTAIFTTNQIPYETLTEPLWLAEDFGNYSLTLPTCYFFIGLSATSPLHASTFDFDEIALVRGVEAFYAIGENYA